MVFLVKDTENASLFPATISAGTTAGKIVVVSPFSEYNTCALIFKLPTGATTQPHILLPAVSEKYENGSVYEFNLTLDITTYPGSVEMTAQFTDSDGLSFFTNPTTFNVVGIRGVATPDYSDVDAWAEAFKLISSLGSIIGINTSETDSRTIFQRLAEIDSEMLTKSTVEQLNALSAEVGKKADAESVYTKSQTDGKLILKANKEDVYTKTETDQKIKEYGAFVFRGNAVGIVGGNIYVDEGKTSFFALKSTNPESGDELYAFTIQPFGNDITVTYSTDLGSTETKTYTVGDTVRVRLNGGYSSSSFSMALMEAQEASGDLYSLGEVLTIDTVYAYVDSDTGEITNTEKIAKDPETIWGSFSQDYGNKFPIMTAYGAGTTPAASKGDTWQIGDREYAFNGSEWVELGFNIDLSGFAKKTEVVPKDAESIGSTYTGHTYSAYLWDDTDGKTVRRSATHASTTQGSTPNGVVLYDSSGHIFIRDDMIEHDGDAVNKKYVDTALGDVSTALAAILGV